MLSRPLQVLGLEPLVVTFLAQPLFEAICKVSDMTFAALNASDLRSVARVTLQLLLDANPGLAEPNLAAITPDETGDYRGELASMMDSLVGNWSFAEEEIPRPPIKMVEPSAIAAVHHSDSSVVEVSDSEQLEYHFRSTSVETVQQEMEQLHAQLLCAREISPSEARILQQSLHSNMALMGSLHIQEQLTSSSTDNDECKSVDVLAASPPSSPLITPEESVQPPPRKSNLSSLTAHTLEEMGITASKCMYLMTQMLHRLDDKTKITSPKKPRQHGEGERRAAQNKDDAAAVENLRMCFLFDHDDDSIFETSVTGCLFALQWTIDNFHKDTSAKLTSFEAREKIDMVRVALQRHTCSRVYFVISFQFLLLNPPQNCFEIQDFYLDIVDPNAHIPLFLRTFFIFPLLTIAKLVRCIIFQFMSTCDHLRSLLCHAVNPPTQPGAESLPTVLRTGLILAQTLSRESTQSTSSFPMCIESVRRVFVSMCKSHLTALAGAVGTQDAKGSCVVLTRTDSVLA